VRYADDLLAMCKTREEAEAALCALRLILAELGLELKDAKTRIVHLAQGGEGVDFLGFQHRWVRCPSRPRPPPGAPAERDRALGQLILTLEALGVALNLRKRALAHVHVRRAGKVLTLDPAHPRISSASLRMRAIAAASSRRIRSRASGPNDSHTASIGPDPATGRAS
jgi:hypothetical protein